MNYIKVKGLSKSYSDIKALKNLSMEIEAIDKFFNALISE